MLLAAPISAGAAILLFTELLSGTVGITQATMAAVSVAAGILLALKWRAVRFGWRRLSGDVRRWRTGIAHDAQALPGSRWWLWTALGATCLILLATFFLALWGPPNNIDSLGYHLPRVMHWLQNESVDHYATNDLRQLGIPTLAGYCMLWLYGLSGSDYLLNMVQWVAALWSCIVVASILRRVCANWVPAAIAFALAVSVPIGIAESTTTQSDWVGALWVILAAGLVVERRAGRIPFIAFAVLLGTACALVSASKQTATLSMGVIVVLAAALELIGDRRPTWRGARHALLLGLTATSGLIVGALPQAVRNLSTFDSATGETFGVIAERFDFVTVAGNSLRIIINNVGLPTQVADLVNPQLEPLFGAIGLPWIDPEAVGYGHLPAISLQRTEDFATSPIQLVCGLLAALAVMFMVRTPRPLRGLAAAGLSMFLLTALVWKWNQWGNRFLIQVILMLVIPLAYLLWRAVATAGASPIRVAAKALVVLTVLYGIFAATTMQSRPIFDAQSVLFTPRAERYFTGQSEAQRVEYLQQGAMLTSVESGSVVDARLEGVLEYPLWAIFNADRRLRFIQLDVKNSSSKYEESNADLRVCIGTCSNQP
jgi:hypothetical protein